MKVNVKEIIKQALMLLCLAFLIISCEPREYADADYPDQLIYMPAAIYNPYLVDSIFPERGSTPTPGSPQRFLADTVNRKVHVLLGVYRSGINNAGNVRVNISVDNDTINDMILAGSLPTGTIPLVSDKYTLPTSLVVADGQELGKFELTLNMDTLLKGYPTKKYAIGVKISSPDRETNPKFETSLIVIDTKFMKPTANFAAVVTASTKSVKFNNSSLRGVKFKWNFGDGQSSEEKNTTHVYENSGTYTVTLTVIGVSGYPERSLIQKSVTIP